MYWIFISFIQSSKNNSEFLLDLFDKAIADYADFIVRNAFSFEDKNEEGRKVKTILPATDTPGAKDLRVPAFVEEMVHKVYSKDRQTLFIDRLEEFNEQAIQKSGREFADLDADQKHEFINDQNRKALKLEGDSFFLMAKELTIREYFTTKVGATQVLKYEAIPGRYNACVPLENVGRTWAT